MPETAPGAERRWCPPVHRAPTPGRGEGALTPLLRRPRTTGSTPARRRPPTGLARVQYPAPVQDLRTANKRRRRAQILQARPRPHRPRRCPGAVHAYSGRGVGGQRPDDLRAGRRSRRRHRRPPGRRRPPVRRRRRGDRVPWPVPGHRHRRTVRRNPRPRAGTAPWRCSPPGCSSPPGPSRSSSSIDARSNSSGRSPRPSTDGELRGRRRSRVRGDHRRPTRARGHRRLGRAGGRPDRPARRAAAVDLRRDRGVRMTGIEALPATTASPDRGPDHRGSADCGAASSPTIRPPGLATSCWRSWCCRSIVMYYQQYVAGAVSFVLLAYFQMSFRFYLTVVVVSSLAGALSSLIASVADRVGRANIVVVGLLVVGLVTSFGIPDRPHQGDLRRGRRHGRVLRGDGAGGHPGAGTRLLPAATTRRGHGVLDAGPVLGSLTVSLVASQTLDSHPHWQFQFRVAGAVGLAVFVLALAFLRELAPGLRDQIMTSLRERVLTEVRSRGLDVEDALKRPFRQMAGRRHADPVARGRPLPPDLPVRRRLLRHLLRLGLRLQPVGGQRAGELVLVRRRRRRGRLVGIVSDRMRVRKPFMLAGGIVAVVMGLVFASLATRPHTTYSTFVVVIMVMSASRGVAYAPWMAAYTETLERRNPALVATGLAIWGWILRHRGRNVPSWWSRSWSRRPRRSPTTVPTPRRCRRSTRPRSPPSSSSTPPPSPGSRPTRSDRAAEVAAITQISEAADVPLRGGRRRPDRRVEDPGGGPGLPGHARAPGARRPGGGAEAVAALVVRVRRRRAPVPADHLPAGRAAGADPPRWPTTESHDRTVTEEFEELAASEDYTEGVTG